MQTFLAVLSVLVDVAAAIKWVRRHLDAYEARQEGRAAQRAEDKERHDARVSAADRAAKSVDRDSMYDNPDDFRD